MKISYARLRSGVNYKGPLRHIVDSFCELHKMFIERNPKFQYGVYNFGFNKANRRKLDDMPDSDVIIIPSENEFHYHIKNYIDPMHRESSDKAIAELIPLIKDKHVIILCSDRGDNVELYREKVFKGEVKNISLIDECDIPGNIHQLKYHFIKENIPTSLFEPEPRCYDFVYWGTDKRKNTNNELSGDERHTVLRQIQKDDKLNSYFIGRYASVKRDMKIDTMYNLLPYLTNAKYTLCFNWIDNKATTARYHEALACGIIPIAWADTYDVNGILVKDKWQRVLTLEEFYDKIASTNYEEKYNEIHETYKKSLMSKEEIYQHYEDILMRTING
jgi:hypothetical protein